MTRFVKFLLQAAVIVGCLIAGVLLLSMLIVLTGCVVGPHYSRPDAPVPPSYKEAATPPQNAGPPGTTWSTAQPGDQFAKGNWWEIFGDPQLNQLETQIDVSNQNLKVAQAQYMQARALVRYDRADYFPSVSTNPSAARTRVSSTLVSTVSGKTYNTFVLPFEVSYEPDVWGRVRRTVESARENAQASEADLATVNLALHAELAMDYLQARGLDTEEQLLNSTAASYQETYQFTLNRFHGGIASEVDVDQAETQLQTTRAQAIDVQVARAQYEHAIAVLLGKPPAMFTLASSPLHLEPPTIPASLPSELLQRRPDIAATERLVASANAQIGIAKSAYYPIFSLGGSGGVESAAIGSFLNGPSGFWSVGAAAFETIFDAGRRHAVSDQAWAVYDQNVANYRQTVLTAFQEVEDNLAAQRILRSEAATQDLAVAAAQRSLAQSINRYKGGVATYLEVTTAQSVALTDERAAVQILERRNTASVLLIKALGGGWHSPF